MKETNTSENTVRAAVAIHRMYQFVQGGQFVLGKIPSMGMESLFIAHISTSGYS